MTFREKYMRHEAAFDEIFDLTDEWNFSDDMRTLREFLGLTEEEEDVWISESDEALEALLEKQYKGKDGKQLSGAEAIALKQMEKALKGDAKAFELVRDTAGQKPIEKVEQVNIDVEYDASVEYVKDLMAKRDE